MRAVHQAATNSCSHAVDRRGSARTASSLWRRGYCAGWEPGTWARVSGCSPAMRQGAHRLIVVPRYVRGGPLPHLVQVDRLLHRFGAAFEDAVTGCAAATRQLSSDVLISQILARPAGLEPATPGLEDAPGRIYEEKLASYSKHSGRQRWPRVARSLTGVRRASGSSARCCVVSKLMSRSLDSQSRGVSGMFRSQYEYVEIESITQRGSRAAQCRFRDYRTGTNVRRPRTRHSQ